MTSRGMLALVALALVGCSWLGPKRDPTRFYVLTTAPLPTTPLVATVPSVGIGPIELPDYLERTQLVTRLRSNELKLAEYERWGEPLKDAFARTLRQDLAAQLGEARVVLYPWERAGQPEVAVIIYVQRFERIETSEVDLRVRWTLRDTASGKTLLTREADLRRPITGSDPQAAVAALSGVLGELGHDIATEIARQQITSQR